MFHMIGRQCDGYGPDGRRRYFKGGGGDAVKYDSLEALYEEQAASARLLREQAEANLPNAVNAYVGEVQDVLAPDYTERRANLAGADMASANAKERAATERSLSSMGVNPNDPRFASSMRATEVNNAARLAAGKNLTRNEADTFQLNVAKDAVGTFTGQSNNAATQMGNAASGLGSIYASQANQQMAQDQMQANAIGSAVGGGMAAYSLFQSKDGGKVNGVGLKKILRRADGGEVRGEDYGYGARTDGTPKGRGYFGELKRPDGDISTELSIGINLGGNETEIPMLVPVLSRAEIDHLLSGGEPTESIVRKAADHAKQRIQAGKSPYAGPGETSPLPAVAGIGTKKIERHMLGGTAGGQQNQGFFQMQSIAPPPVAQAPQGGANPVGSAIGTASQVMTAKKLYDKATMGVPSQQAAAPVIEKSVEAAATDTLTSAGADTAATAAAADTAATAAAADAGATAATTAAADAAATTAATTVAAEGTATGLGAAAGALGAASAALPWLGAAYAVGSMLEWWNKGGKAGEQKGGMSDEEARKAFSAAFHAGEVNDIRAGGTVPGEWRENVDSVPALLVEGEGVLNAEAMALGGEQVMNDLNAKGLALRKQGITPTEIKRGIGLRGFKRRAA